MTDAWRSVLVRCMSGIIFVVVFVGIFLWLPAWYFSLLLAACVVEMLIIEWPRLCAAQTMRWAWLLTPLYPLMPMLVLMAVNLSEYRLMVLYVFILAWVHDTCAYAVGNLIGRHKLCPAISPNKTWAGAVGGLLGTFFAVQWLNIVNGSANSLFFVVSVAVLLSILFVLGDLFESWLKRKAHIKDSGRLLPGHGGLLDRFDGVLFAAYALWVAWWFAY